MFARPDGWAVGRKGREEIEGIIHLAGGRKRRKGFLFYRFEGRTMP